MDGWTNKPKDGKINEWTVFLSYTDTIEASKNDDFPTDFAMFTEALRTSRQTNRQTYGPTD